VCVILSICEDHSGLATRDRRAYDSKRAMPLWYMVYGILYMVYGIWYIVYVYMVYVYVYMVYGICILCMYMYMYVNVVCDTTEEEEEDGGGGG